MLAFEELRQHHGDELRFPDLIAPAAGLLMVGRLVSLKFLTQVASLVDSTLNCHPAKPVGVFLVAVVLVGVVMVVVVAFVVVVVVVVVIVMVVAVVVLVVVIIVMVNVAFVVVVVLQIIAVTDLLLAR